jgi:hypothetical protein
MGVAMAGKLLQDLVTTKGRVYGGTGNSGVRYVAQQECGAVNS